MPPPASSHQRSPLGAIPSGGKKSSTATEVAPAGATSDTSMRSRRERTPSIPVTNWRASGSGEHLVGARTDLVGGALQQGSIEPEELDGVEPEHLPCFIGWHVGQRGRQRLATVRPGGLGVRIVGTPHDAVDTELVPAGRVGGR